MFPDLFKEGLGKLNDIEQSQIQDFAKEGARFRVKCHVDAIQWGGGGSSRNFS